MALVATSLVGCGGEEGGTNGDGDSSPVAVSIEQALAGEDGRSVSVRGYLVATADGVELASALLESYPPQAGGAALPVTGLDLGALVGLSSTTGGSGLGAVTWSDYPITLQGVIEAGALEVKEVPHSVEETAGELRVRFCLPEEPLISGETTWWVFDVTDSSGGSVDLTFSNGQMGEVVLSQDGVEKYRWSDGKLFTEAIRIDTIEPGDTVAYIFNDILQVAPGQYDLTAGIVASAGDDGTRLPELTIKVTVR
jgi:hypothetical protein